MSNRARQKQQREKKFAASLMDMLKMAAVVAIVVLVVILFIRLKSPTPAQDVFCEGVYVQDIPLAGLTYEEGVQQVADRIHQCIHQNVYTLVYGDMQWTFTPGDFDARLDLSAEIDLAWNFGHTGTDREKREQAARLKKEPVNYRKDILYNDRKLTAFIQDIKAHVDRAPVNAEVTVLEDRVFEFSQSYTGLSLSVDEIKEVLNSNILSGTSTVIELVPHVVEPEYTTQELQENTVLIAKYSTSLANSNSRRTKNVARALRPFNGLRVLPGEIVSFNTLVGKRTKANGFAESPEYDGNTVVTGYGGGACQASSTLYGAILYADLDAVVRGSHSMTVDYCEPSLDAAVFENKDFCFTNNLEYPVYLYTNVTDRTATVWVYGPPSPYDIVIESRVLSVYEAGARKFEDDTSGKYVYFTDDPPVLKTEGKMGMKSQAFRVYCDRETGQEVSREDFDVDTYYASQPVYWRGVHSPLEPGLELEFE